MVYGMRCYGETAVLMHWGCLRVCEGDAAAEVYLGREARVAGGDARWVNEDEHACDDDETKNVDGAEDGECSGGGVYEGEQHVVEGARCRRA